MPRKRWRLLDLSPGAKGTYLLHLALARERVMVVERRVRQGNCRGTFALSTGDYLYVGSAFGPGGLASRVGRHLSPEPKARHWDIDFLLSGPSRPARIEAWGVASLVREECRWAATIARSAVPVVGSVGLNARRDRGFGAADCRNRCGCRADSPATSRTHLFKMGWRPTLGRMRALLGVRLVHLRPVPDRDGLPAGSTEHAPKKRRRRRAVGMRLFPAKPPEVQAERGYVRPRRAK